MQLIRFFTILVSCTLFLSAELQLPDKHPLDETEIKKFTLDNGLKVILVSVSSSGCLSGSCSSPNKNKWNVNKTTKYRNNFIKFLSIALIKL